MSSLARSLRKVFEAISSYPFSTNVTIGGLPFYVQLPLLPPSADHEWALWEDQNAVGDGEFSEPDDEAEELYLTLDRSSTIRLAPWKALLLLDEPSAHAEAADRGGGRVSRSTSGGFAPDQRGRLDSSATAMFGGFWPQQAGSGMSAMPGTASAPDSQTNTPRPAGTPLMRPTPLDSEVTSVADLRELDEDPPLAEESTPLFKMFLAAIKPNLTCVCRPLVRAVGSRQVGRLIAAPRVPLARCSLAEIAQLPNFVDAGIDLKRDLYPLARRLVWKVGFRLALLVRSLLGALTV